MPKRRRRDTPLENTPRFKLLQAIVDEIKEHGRASVKDRDAFLVRLVLRTGLSRVEIEKAATELAQLVSEVVKRLSRGE